MAAPKAAAVAAQRLGQQAGSSSSGTATGAAQAGSGSSSSGAATVAAAVAAPTATAEVFDLDFFKNINVFSGNYKQHNAALKWFRGQQEDQGFSPTAQQQQNLLFSNSEPAAVAEIVKGKGMSYDFDTTTTKTWHWFELVAQLDDASMAYVVEGPDNSSSGLTRCWLAMRPGSYDHKRHHQLKHEKRPQRNAQLRVWDFLLEREDGSSIRLHPQWSTTVVETYAGAGHETEVEPPVRGLGESDGPGTYKHYKEVGTEQKLRFDARKH